jgi:hypothetical protein
MMSERDVVALVEGILKKITYKVGWKFRAQRNHAWDGVEVWISYLDKDATGKTPGENYLNLRVAISMHELSHMRHPEKYLMHRIFEGIRTAEMHEIDEWLKYDGVHVNDPHPERKNEKIQTL